MMNNFPDDMLKHAENELRLIGFDNAIGQFIVGLLHSSYSLTNGNLYYMEHILNMPNHLLSGNVLSPITEEDFEEAPVEGSVYLRCKRYFPVYKDIKTGYYYNDQAVAFIKKDDPRQAKFYMSQNGMSSTKKIELPYIPNEEIVYI